MTAGHDVGIKHDNGKVDYTLIPPLALREVAEALTYGSKKYTRYNWVNVESIRYLAAAYRHLESFRAGNKNDIESNIHHLAHAVTNLLFLLERDLSDKDVVGKTYTSFVEEVLTETSEL